MGVCQGPCPAYTLEVFPDGRVVFAGVSHVRVAHAETRLSPARARQVFQTLDKTLWAYVPCDEAEPLHARTRSLTVRFTEGERVVRHWPPCQGMSNDPATSPRALCALYDTFDGLAKPYVSCGKEPCPSRPPDPSRKGSKKLDDGF